LSAKLVPTFADSGCHVVGVTDPYGLITVFLDRSHYFFFQVAAQLTDADSGCHVVGVTDPYGRITVFLDRSHYFFFQVAAQLYSTRLGGPRSLEEILSESLPCRTEFVSYT
jgi:hypothetical protein